MHALWSTLLFFLATGILFFVPGFIILQIFFRRTTVLLLFETFIFSFGISIGLLDFLMITIGKLHIPLDIFSILLGELLVLGSLYGVVWMRERRRIVTNSNQPAAAAPSFSFSKRQGMLFVLLISLTLCIKVIYLMHAVLPTATDLGHHMYWSKLITTTGTLPFYGKQEIMTDTNNAYQLTDPEPIADFIIGEHLPFAAINMFVGLDFFSAFPITFLLLINIFTLLALFVLALRFASSSENLFLSQKIFTPQNIALATLFFFGPLYTLASPEAKFVSGGVVGNTFGNFFIPLILLVLFRALKEKRASLLALAFFLIFTLAYTHHLSTLMLFFGLLTALFIYGATHLATIRLLFRTWRKLLLSPPPLLVALFCIIFFFGIAMPTYIEINAVGMALGTPTKATRTGLSFLQLASTGQARVAIGLVGCFLFLALRKQKQYAGAFLMSWAVILFVMTLYPKWLFIDIPSDRIVTYFSFPIGLLAAFASIAFFASFQHSASKVRAPSVFILLASLTFFVFSAGDGSLDNSQTIQPNSKAMGVLQTFAASRYLALHSTPEDVILKDHNYIAADAWMKLFFLRDYSYPLSRGVFKRYADNPNREQCTLYMISVPNTESGTKCYDDLGVRFVVINPHLDTTQFEKSQEFSRIYVSDDIHIYERKN